MKVKCENCSSGRVQRYAYDPSSGEDRRAGSVKCSLCNGTGFIDDGRPDYLEYDEYKAGLRAVLASPEDDLPRLVLADWIEEHGRDSERAGHIRFSIQDWIEMTRPGHPGPEPEGQSLMAFREDGSFVKVSAPDGGSQDVGGRVIGWGIETRGFISEVRCTLAAFVGAPCHICGNGFDPRLCSRCMGKPHQRYAGHAKALFEAHPLTKVVLTDREPEHVMPDDGPYFHWLCFGPEIREAEEFIPGSVYKWLPRGDGNRFEWPTRQEAIEALSAACVSFGRSLAFPDEIPAILSDGTPVSIPAGEAPSF